MSEHEMEVEEQEQSSGFAWFIIGAITGAAIALLLAPKSGRDTRRYIADTTERSKTAVTQTTRDILDRTQDIYVRGRQVVEDAADLFERGRKLVKG